MEKPLCKGYVVSGETYKTETLYALLPDGRLFTTGEVPFSTQFGKYAFSLYTETSVPPGAEYIGNYPIPVCI